MFQWPSPCCRAEDGNPIETVGPAEEGKASFMLSEQKSSKSGSEQYFSSKANMRASNKLSVLIKADPEEYEISSRALGQEPDEEAVRRLSTHPESMEMVRKFSIMMAGQIGIDVEATYKADDPEVPAGDGGFNRLPLRSMSMEQLETAVTETVKATEAYLPHKKMNDFQRGWCIKKNVQIYLDARGGNVQQAAESLALALIWRETHKDVLTGARVPSWTGDGRIIAVDPTGHPFMYGCMYHQSRWPSAKGNTEHVGLVMNMCVEMMPSDVSEFDWIIDLHGFRVSSNLDPRATVAIMELLKIPFLNRLRMCFLVDSPKAFAAVWNVAYPHLPPSTREKIEFATNAEAAARVEKTCGPKVASIVRDVMAVNRSKNPSKGSGPPSEKLN